MKKYRCNNCKSIIDEDSKLFTEDVEVCPNCNEYESLEDIGTNLEILYTYIEHWKNIDKSKLALRILGDNVNIYKEDDDEKAFWLWLAEEVNHYK